MLCCAVWRDRLCQEHPVLHVGKHPGLSATAGEGRAGLWIALLQWGVGVWGLSSPWELGVVRQDTISDSPSGAQGLPVLCWIFLPQQGPPCASVSLRRLLMAVQCREGQQGGSRGEQLPFGLLSVE